MVRAAHLGRLKGVVRLDASPYAEERSTQSASRTICLEAANVYTIRLQVHFLNTASFDDFDSSCLRVYN